MVDNGILSRSGVKQEENGKISGIQQEKRLYL
jgi:hypothetical protein